MRYCGVVTDNNYSGANGTFWDKHFWTNIKLSIKEVDRPRIYSDEVTMASSRTLLNIRGNIVDSLSLVRK